MGAIHQVLLGASRSVDPNFSSVVLLCPFVGSDGSTSITDIKNHVLTAIGDAQIDTAQFKWPPSSLLLDGTGDAVTSPDSADWAFGSGDFTIDGWVRFNSTTGDQAIVSQWETPTQRSFVFRKASTGNLELIYSRDGGSVNVVTCTGAWGPSTGTWYYVAAKRATTTLTVWVDGSQLGTVSAGTDTLFNSTALLRIGCLFVSPSNSQFFNGWEGTLRITKGVARDVSIVPTGPFPTS